MIYNGDAEYEEDNTNIVIGDTWFCDREILIKQVWIFCIILLPLVISGLNYQDLTNIILVLIQKRKTG